MYRTILLLALVATGIVTSPALAGAAPVTAAAPRQAALTTSDLPGKFRQLSARPLTRATAGSIASIPTNTLSHGYRSGFESSFTRDFSVYRNPSQARGLFTIVDEVLAYKKVSGAHAVFRLAARGIRKQVRKNKKVRFLSFGHAGAERIGYQGAETVTRGTVLVSDVLVFRAGADLVAVTASGQLRRASDANGQIAALAQTIARRITG